MTLSCALMYLHTLYVATLPHRSLLPWNPAVFAPPLPAFHRCFQALLARLLSLLVGMILHHFSF